MENVKDLALDLAQLGVDSAQGPQPFAPAPPSTLDQGQMQGQMQQLETLLLQFAQHGVIERRADGSFIPAGLADPRKAQIDRQGSDCHCTLCTPYNQRHWYCAGPGCYSGPHEWVIDQPKAEPRQVLGEAGKGGRAYQFCHPQCRVNFMNAMHAAQRVYAPSGLDAIPVAGGGE